MPLLYARDRQRRCAAFFFFFAILNSSSDNAQTDRSEQATTATGGCGGGARVEERRDNRLVQAHQEVGTASARAHSPPWHAGIPTATMPHRNHSLPPPVIQQTHTPLVGNVSSRYCLPNGRDIVSVFHCLFTHSADGPRIDFNPRCQSAFHPALRNLIVPSFRSYFSLSLFPFHPCSPFGLPPFRPLCSWRCRSHLDYFGLFYFFYFATNISSFISFFFSFTDVAGEKQSINQT